MRISVWRSMAAIVVLLMLVSASACGGADTGDSATSGETPAGQTPGQPADQGEVPGSSATETEVSGMPAEFPSDVPVHPGTVTDYQPTQVTDTAIVHQLYVVTQASLTEVTEWYHTALPAGWSVGFFEDVDGEGEEAKISLEGGDYTPADPDGAGGGVMVGVFATDDGTLIVTTLGVMDAP